MAAVVALFWVASAAAFTPNDPTWPQAWAQQRVNMGAAWDLTTGNPNVVIAVVDSGVDPSQPDLQGELVPGWDFLANTWTSQDSDGHGTLTATIIAGKGNNGTDGTGYCWGCRVMPVRVSSNGSFDSTMTANGVAVAVIRTVLSA